MLRNVIKPLRCALGVTLALMGAVVAGMQSDGGVGAQATEPGELASPLFGLTVAWAGGWQAQEATQDGGAVWIHLTAEQGRLTLWAAPAFGGNEALCVADAKRRLQADQYVSELESGPEPSPLLFPGGESAAFTMQYDQEDGQVAPWNHVVWCVTLQPGYSVLQVELQSPVSQFNQIVEAAADVVVTTTEGLAAPPFEFAQERDDLTSFWSQQFVAWGRDQYVAPSYVSFDAPQSTACGPTSPLDIGYHYCTADNGVFVDAAAAEDLGARYGRSINLFLLAHETGHHVELLLGYSSVCELADCLTGITDVQWELLADCFAGAWMANASERGILSDTDVEEVLVGVADSFSDSGHGSSALRLWWLLQGFHHGVDACFEPEEI